MAIEVGFGGVAVTQSYTDKYVYSDGVPMPTGRTMANGSRACLVTAVRGFAAGRGAARAMGMSLGPSGTYSNFTVGSAGSAQNTGWQSIPPFLAQGGTARFTMYFTGSTYFGRDSVGSGIDSYGTNFGNLGGGYLYAQAPSNPGFNVLEGTGSGAVHWNIAGVGDDGGSSVNGYRIQWARDTGFTQALGQEDHGTAISDLDHVVSGFPIGIRYYFRIAAKNAVTDAAGSTGPWSGTYSVVIPGVPSAPQNLSVTPSNTQFDTMSMSWSAPADTGGGITGYNIYNGPYYFGAVYGTGTTFTATNLVKNAHYSWNVKATNAYGDSTGQRSAPSNTVEIYNYSTPSAPQNLTAIANSSVAGRIDLSWSPPSDIGVSGITRYSVYASTGTKIADVGGSTTTYSVTGLTPGTYYAFYIYAWTAKADQVGTPGPASNTAGAGAVGQPPAPTNLVAQPSTMVPGRLVLTWTQPAGYTGFNVYETTNGATTLLATVVTPKLVLDGVTPTTHTYVVAARNAVTDTTTPVSEGPRSSVSAPAKPGQTASITLAGVDVPDLTNAIYNGSYKITGISATSVSFALTMPDQVTTSVPPGVGTLIDSTNAGLSGTHTITATPTTTSFSFAQTGANIPSNTAVTNVTATDTTNTIFNGTFTVSSVDATNFLVSYAVTAANIASTAASGTITNLSNTIYNGTGLTITTIPNTNQFTYAKTNANLAETTASGTVTDTTNQNFYNATPTGRGAATVLTAPTYNTLTYTLASGLTQATTAVVSPLGSVYRATSKASLEIKYRSGWAG